MSQPKSDFAKGLDAVQGAVHSFLKPLGFRKKGHTHNRATDGGLLHVINSQMGSFGQLFHHRNGLVCCIADRLICVAPLRSTLGRLGDR